MDMESRNSLKNHGPKRLINSFKYAIQGLVYAFKKEQNMLIHVIICITVIALGILLKISYFEWLICFILFGLVMSTELINSAIEALVDLVSPNKHPLAKIAKDTASAAVFIFALVALVSGIFILLPKILMFIK